MTANTLIMALYFAVIPDMSGDVMNVWNNYLAGDFKGVKQQVLLLTESPFTNNRDKAILWLTLGCSEAMLGNSIYSTEAFKISMDFHPDLGVTEADLPPPVWVVYENVRMQIKDEIEEQLPVKLAAGALNKSVSEPEVNITGKPSLEKSDNSAFPNNSSALKSVMFPGWGQFSDGRESGKYIIAAEVALITGFIITAVQSSHARDDYMRARTPSEIEDKYEKYNNISRLSTGLAIASFGTYLFAQFDYFAEHNMNFSSFGDKPYYLLSISLTM